MRIGILRAILALAVTVAGVGILYVAPAQAADPCAPLVNPIACENSKTGSPESEWGTGDEIDDDLQGFATEASVNAGGSISFKVSTNAPSYTIDIYRMGYYGGDGARKWASITPTKRTQPTCMQDQTVGLTDCGNWAVSATWAVPSNAVSGVYVARAYRSDTNSAAGMAFVVRNDASTSPILFQTSDTTWQAYNTYGQGSFYSGANGRAYQVSYNRPTPLHGQNMLFAYEYPMIRFMEENGYDVSYATDLDADRYGSLIKNHKTYMTAGHDEYWSGAQRANITAARDAGVNLAFFTGNDDYWRTRWLPSIDGSNTANRTLVCYKETWDEAKTDPSPEWTGTWRDPRFTTAPNGALPENALGGTAYMSNNTDLALTVPAADGKMRFWRNSSVATNAANGTTSTLAAHTVGYESNEDLDNGFRPAGLFRMSTTTGSVPEYLQDYGLVVAPGTTTHNLTMYKAASGAKVFSAGTIQWSWGLDTYHDLTASTTSTPMQQATVNLFADMGAQPATLMSGLTTATASTDTTAPTSAITSPASGASLASGSVVAITGTATDSGGQVAGIEVSTDNGNTWHPATSGRASWSYNWTVTGLGSTTIKVRATDDSGNIETATASRTVTVTCPCTLFANKAPKTASVTDTAEIEAGVRFSSSVDGWVSGVRFYKGAGNTGSHTGSLWSTDGTRLTTGSFSNETATGWQTLNFAKPVQITAGTTYVASYHAPNGGYAADSAYFWGKGETATPLTAPASITTALNGVYAAGASRYPSDSYKSTNYWVAPIFDTVKPPDVTPPTPATVTPPDNASSVKVSVTPTIEFSEPIAAGTTTLKLQSAAGLVAGTTTFDSARTVATFTPSAPLANATTYTLSTVGGTDDAGNVLATTSTIFKTATASNPGVCPCSIWSDSDAPSTASANDSNAVEVGVKFQADSDGWVDGIRFYKGSQNTGTHTGTLWSSTGTQLATATFTNESSTGWQEVRFASRVAVTAGTTYVASYYAPAGRYAADNNGLTNAVVNSPLTALAAGTPGGNGVYVYGAHAFPSNGTGANYWVDVVFELPPDTTPPAVASTTPGTGATNVAASVTPKATFSEKVTGGVTATITGPNNVAVAGTVAMDATGKVATITPGSALADATTYKVTVNGAKDTAGNTMTTAYSWTFKTSGATACPCTLYSSDYVPAVTSSTDTAGLELGVRFTPSTTGYVTGVRFYKGAGNTGTHTGRLWSSAGALLSSATFTNETASGWQEVTFAGPIAVTAGTTYVASYSDPNGHYAADSGQLATALVNGPLTAPADSASTPNGAYSGTVGGFPNASYGSTGYGVDVVFTAAAPNDTTPPGLVSTNPADGATSVPLTQAFTATFNEGLAAGATGSVTAGVTTVPATVTVGADQTVTVTPNAPLAYDTAYTIKVSGSDLSGNAMTAPAQWSVRTAKAPSTTCPCTLWTDETQPATAAVSDTAPVEVGVKFTPSTAGQVTGVRFFKGAANTGTHTGSLWSITGTRLATGTFTGESASGWQQLTFDQPVTVTAGTTYVASYYTPSGKYAVTAQGLLNAVTRGPLTAPAGTAPTGPNGVYLYGSGGFPVNGDTSNYWVDPVFSDTSAPADTTPPTVTGTTPAAAATNVAASTSPTATFSEPIDTSTLIATVTPAAGAPIAVTTSYASATRTVTINPGSALASATSYTVSVRASDVAGNAMAAATTWQFTTADVTAPVVTASTPADQATNVARATAPTATFSKALDASTIVASVTPAGGSAVTATTAYDTATRKVTVTPAAQLAAATKYTVSVRASDTLGNAMAAPTTWQFTTLDNVPPVVTAVAASGSGTSATVTWTTDEPSTSFVDYGTSATALSSTATSSGSVTSHSVTLTGLTVNTRYYYRVRSADPSANSTTSPATTSAAAQYAPTTTPVTQTSAADFGTGAVSSTYVGSRDAGEVVLNPTGGVDEFSGTTVPTTWTSTSLATGSAVTVGSGVATVSGRLFKRTATVTSGRDLDAVVTFRNVNNQWFGLTNGDYTSTANNWASFHTNATGGLVAETRNGGAGSTSTTLASTLLGAAHRYTIDWNGGTITYSVDGTVVATHTRTFTVTTLNVTARDATVDANPLLLDSVWVTPYATTGTWTSAVIDAGATVDWRIFTPTTTLPAGTTITYQVRTGPNATAGGTGWSGFTTVAAGADLPGTTRYLQYRATLTTTAANSRSVTPTLSAVSIGYAVP